MTCSNCQIKINSKVYIFEAGCHQRRGIRMLPGTFIIIRRARLVAIPRCLVSAEERNGKSHSGHSAYLALLLSLFPRPERISWVMNYHVEWRQMKTSPIFI